jgi:hypothetical protein
MVRPLLMKSGVALWFIGALSRATLLPLPAVGDNAAMEANRKRRWFQFSLRSLLAIVTPCALLTPFVIARCASRVRVRLSLERAE